MKAETIENILNFLNEKEGKEVPDKWKLIKELETHPDGTQYKHRGSLDLSDTNISKLPNDLYVDGHLVLRNCNQLTELPNNLYVKYGLILDRCKQLTELPNKLFVGGDLFLRGTIFATEYSDEEIREIIISKGGAIIGGIYTS